MSVRSQRFRAVLEKRTSVDHDCVPGRFVKVVVTVVAWRPVPVDVVYTEAYNWLLRIVDNGGYIRLGEFVDVWWKGAKGASVHNEGSPIWVHIWQAESVDRLQDLGRVVWVVCSIERRRVNEGVEVDTMVFLVGPEECVAVFCKPDRVVFNDPEVRYLENRTFLACLPIPNVDVSRPRAVVLELDSGKHCHDFVRDVEGHELPDGVDRRIDIQ